jgi:ATP-dependent Clp protease ATP-binding subunit ClpC
MHERLDLGENVPRPDTNPLVTMDETFDDETQEEVAEVDLERLTPSARDALDAAAIEAEKMGDEFVGTDHVLLALSRTEHCAARNLLETYELTTERLIEMMRFVRGVQPNGAGEFERTYSPRLLRVLTIARKDANKAMQAEIGTIHLLSGLLREGDGLAVFLLESVGLSNKRADFVLEFAAREGWKD